MIHKEGWDRRRWLGLELISSEKRHQGKVGAETEGKIKSGVEAGELGPPASGCYYKSIMRNREAAVAVVVVVVAAVVGRGMSLHLGTL